MTASITFPIDKTLYIRNPEETALGKKIVAESIKLLDEDGYDAFTFRKLALRIESTEASVYRYFKNKHQLLCYLVSWYWSWLEYLIEYRTQNITDPKRRLEIAISALLDSDTDDPNVPHIDESVLHRVVISESARAYMTRPAELSDYKGILHGYNLICSKLIGFIKAIDPKYKYSRELMETLMSSAHSLVFTLYQSGEKRLKKSEQRGTENFLNHLVFTSLEN
jgi:AcrR family transcriptional regulator